AAIRSRPPTRSTRASATSSSAAGATAGRPPSTACRTSTWRSTKTRGSSSCRSRRRRSSRSATTAPRRPGRRGSPSAWPRHGRPGVAEGSRELLLAESLTAHAGAGLEEASFGIISVARVGTLDAATKGKRRLARFLERLGTTYGYNDLFGLKDAFGPRWESRHLAFPGERSLPRVALALAD